MPTPESDELGVIYLHVEDRFSAIVAEARYGLSRFYKDGQSVTLDSKTYVVLSSFVYGAWYHVLLSSTINWDMVTRMEGRRDVVTRSLPPPRPRGA